MAAALAACEGGSRRTSPPTSPTVPAATSTTVRTLTLTAVLTGPAVVPGPASSGAGQARLLLDPDAGQLCWEVTISGVDAPTAVHLHTAPLGAVGPVTVPMTATAGCAAVPPELAASVAANPAGFYVDVHSEAFPAGAARGQLGR